MQGGGQWCRWVVCAWALAGCFSRSNLDADPDGDAGQAGVDDSGSGAKAGRGGGGPGSGSGGKATAGHGPSSGGSAGMGESCSSAPACGGDITGTWTVASSCLDVTGVMDLVPLGIGCASAPVTGSRTVAGTFTANADGTYLDQTTTSGAEQIQLAAECLNVSGVVVMCERLSAVIGAYGYDSVTCAPADDGRCLCDAVFSRASGLGTLAFDPLETGTFTTSGNIVTLDDEWNEPKSYQYCVSARQLTLLPVPSYGGTLRGTVVLADR